MKVFYYKEEVPSAIDDYEFEKALEFFCRMDDREEYFDEYFFNEIIEKRDEKYYEKLDFIRIIRNAEEREDLDSYYRAECSSEEEEEKMEFERMVCNAKILKEFLPSKYPEEEEKITILKKKHDYFKKDICKSDCMLFKSLSLLTPTIQMCDSQIKNYSCQRSRMMPL